MNTEQYTWTVRQGNWGRTGWLKRKLKRPLPFKGPNGKKYTVNFRLYIFTRNGN